MSIFAKAASITLIIWLTTFIAITNIALVKESLSINTLGLFGDSFGALNALFSGLAMAGAFSAAFTQHKQLKITIADSNRNARLIALSELLKEYNSNLDRLVSAINNSTNPQDKIKFGRDFESYQQKKETIIAELENLTHLK
jgi:glutamate synthase domain-containing protein 3